MSKALLGYLGATLMGVLIARYALPANGTASTESIEPENWYDTTYVENDYDPVALIERLDQAEANYRAVSKELEQLKQELEDDQGNDDRRESFIENREELAEAIPELVRERVQQNRRNNDPEAQREQLINAGFNESELDYIDQARADYTQQQLENRLQTMRENPENYQNVLDPLGYQSTREALGDERFEEYLTALGRDTSVNTRAVTPGSAADLAGIQEGDEIYSYDGSRVFQTGDVTRGTISGNPGDNVIVEVLREGAVVPLTVERGALGVTLGNGGRRGGGGRSNR